MRLICISYKNLCLLCLRLMLLLNMLTGIISLFLNSVRLVTTSIDSYNKATINVCQLLLSFYILKRHIKRYSLYSRKINKRYKSISDKQINHRQYHG